MINQNKKEQYNEEPVHYCDNCLSLKIKTLGAEIDYCADCGNTDILEDTIEVWEDLYETKYNKKHLTDEKCNSTTHSN